MRGCRKRLERGVPPRFQFRPLSWARPWLARTSGASLAAPAGIVALALLTLFARSGTAYRAGAPPAHTGGFGEPTCRQCHMDYELNESGGGVALAGIPDAYAPGQRYTIEITVTHPDLRVGGFQLSVRSDGADGEGRQAGSLRPLDDRVAVVHTPVGTEYARHTAAGILPMAADTARWALEWTAPADAAPVIFHVAANAANDDNSELGDRIYTTSARVHPKSSK